MLTMRDSHTVRVIAVLTMMFLPTTAVATVAGSQLLVTEVDELALGRYGYKITLI